MCGIFGIVRYDASKVEAVLDHKYLLERLGYHSEDRGKHAGGIAFKNRYGDIEVIKDAGAISKNGTFDDLSKHIKDARSFMGHTRFTTVGTADKNENNHPFKSVFDNYAMAHNGTVSNVLDLEIQNNLPQVTVDTDSFVFSRMIDHTTDGVSHENLKEVAEQIRGTFNFTIIDEDETIWLVKNNNPLVVVDFEDIGLIAYASTEDIMLESILDTYSLNNLDAVMDVEMVKPFGKVMRPKPGEIWEIKKSGEIVKSEFTPLKNYTSSYGYGGYGGYGYGGYGYGGYGYGGYDTCKPSTTPTKNKKKSKFNNTDKVWEVNGIPEYMIKDKAIIHNGDEIEVTDAVKTLNYNQYTAGDKGTKQTRVCEESVYSWFKTQNLVNETKNDKITKNEFDFVETLSSSEIESKWTFKEIYNRMMRERNLTPDVTGVSMSEFDKFFDEIVEFFYEMYGDVMIESMVVDYGKDVKDIVTSTLFAGLLNTYLDESLLLEDDNPNDYMLIMEALDDMELRILDILQLGTTSMMFTEADVLIHLKGIIKLLVKGAI